MLAHTAKESTLSSGINAFTVPTKRKQNFDAEKEKKNDTTISSQNKSNKWSHNDSSSSSADQNNSLEMINNNIARLEALSPISSIEPWNTNNVDNLSENSISKLQAITVTTTSDHWQSPSNPSRSFRTTAELLNSEDDMDDDIYDDDDDDDEEQMSIDYGLRQQHQQQQQQHHHHHQCLSQRSYYSSVHGYIRASLCSEPFLHQNGNPKLTFNPVASRTANANFPWINSMSNGGYSIQPVEHTYSSHQTIKRAENGKSYLDLGSSSFSSSIDAKRPKKCCDGRGAWCNGGRNCYKEIRLRVRNISMFKLSRFRQVSEHSLYRSVLICNTLKHIEKEIDLDNRELCQKINSQFSLSQSQQTMNSTRIPDSNPNGRLDLQMSQQHNSLNPVENKDFRISNQKQQTTVLPNIQSSYNNDFLHSYDNYPFNDSQFSGRVTPFPNSYCSTDIDSGYGDDDESNRSINWSSVLSLSSQSALDPLSNNDHFTTTPTSTTLNPLSSDSSSAIGISSNGFSSSSPSLLSQSPLTAAGNGTLNNQVSSSSSSSLSSEQSLSSSSSSSSSSPMTTTTTTLEYGFFDMDLGLGHNITELLPNYKLSSNDILKSISSSISSPKFCHESNLESPARIMVGS